MTTCHTVQLHHVFIVHVARTRIPFTRAARPGGGVVTREAPVDAHTHTESLDRSRDRDQLWDRSGATVPETSPDGSAHRAFHLRGAARRPRGQRGVRAR